ncbi:MAG: amino acid ABC transporter permease [Rhizobium sp.]
MASREHRIVPRRSWVTAVMGFLALVLVLLVIYALASSQHVRWSEVWRYLFAEQMFKGLAVTIVLTVICMVVGSLLGLLLALMRMSGNVILKGLSSLFIWFFRSVPLLVQLIFWFNIGLFVPKIGLGSYSISTNDVVTGFVAAVLALVLHEAAYMAEVIRAGIKSVGSGQAEAASAVGMTPFQSLLWIVGPQAFRVILPPTSNQAISLLKATSLVSVIAAQDLMTQAQDHLHADLSRHRTADRREPMVSHPRFPCEPRSSCLGAPF